MPREPVGGFHSIETLVGLLTWGLRLAGVVLATLMAVIGDMVLIVGSGV
jgi:hypothetical protein